jgi:hypothetical protein
VIEWRELQGALLGGVADVIQQFYYTRIISSNNNYEVKTQKSNTTSSKSSSDWIGTVYGIKWTLLLVQCKDLNY